MHNGRGIILTMKIIMLKKPKKPTQYIVVDKKSEKWAEDLVSTTNVLKPNWKCEMIESTAIEDGFPASVMHQAIVEPLRLTKNEEIIRWIMA